MYLFTFTHQEALPTANPMDICVQGNLLTTTTTPICMPTPTPMDICVEDNLDIATAPLETAPTRKSTFQSRRIRTTSMPTSNFSFVYNGSHTTFLDNKEIIFKLLLGGNQIYCEKCRDTHLFHKCGGTY